jgi:predicted nucleotidyltransferase
MVFSGAEFFKLISSACGGFSYRTCAAGAFPPAPATSFLPPDSTYLSYILSSPGGYDVPWPSHLRGDFNLTGIKMGFTLYRMGIQEIIGRQKEQILALAAKYGVYNVRVFGSVANGTADDTSDVDFLVELEDGRSLFDLGGLLMDLQGLLHREVDVVTEKGLHWYIRDKIIKEAKPL